MALVWFMAGVLVPTAYILTRSWERTKAGRLSTKSWVSLGATLALLEFCVLWVVSSLIEGEGRAALMGALIFGGITVVSAAISRVLAARDLRGQLQRSAQRPR